MRKKQVALRWSTSEPVALTINGDRLLEEEMQKGEKLFPPGSRIIMTVRPALTRALSKLIWTVPLPFTQIRDNMIQFDLTEDALVELEVAHKYLQSLHIKVMPAALRVAVRAQPNDYNGVEILNIDGDQRFLSFERGQEVTLTLLPGIKSKHSLDKEIKWGNPSWQVVGQKPVNGTEVTLTLNASQEVVLNLEALDRPELPSISDREFHLMVHELKSAIPPDSFNNHFVILWDGQPIKVLNSVFFPSERAARLAVQRLLNISFPSFRTRLTERQKEWIDYPDNKEKFIEKWIHETLTFMPFPEFAASRFGAVNKKGAPTLGSFF